MQMAAVFCTYGLIHDPLFNYKCIISYKVVKPSQSPYYVQKVNILSYNKISCKKN
jgi:hypothetical protein